jgi:dynein light chain LC8-type
MDPASEELERRSRYLSALVRRTRLADPPQPEPEAAEEAKADAVEPGLKEGKGGKEEETKAKERAAVKAKAKGEGRKVAVCVRAADMALPLQRRAVRIAVEAVAAMPRLETKRLALALKKV